MVHCSVLGAGRLGGALARRLAALGHTVDARVPDPADRKYAELVNTKGISVGPADKAPQETDVVFLATPWGATEVAIKPLGDGNGRIVVDCTNPVTYGEGGMSLAIDANTSAAETLQRWLPEARLVKTLNQVGADVLADPARLQPAPMMGLAGDDADAKDEVGRVLKGLGFDPFDVGGLGNARLLESFALIWMSQAFASGDPGGFAFGRAKRI